MPRGQELYDTPVRGGWFTGGAKLKRILERVGVPAEAPPAPASPTSPSKATPPSASDSGMSAREIGAIAAGGVIVALALGFAVRAIRRPRRAITT